MCGIDQVVHVVHQVLADPFVDLVLSCGFAYWIARKFSSPPTISTPPDPTARSPEKKNFFIKYLQIDKPVISKRNVVESFLPRSFLPD